MADALEKFRCMMGVARLMDGRRPSRDWIMAGFPSNTVCGQSAREETLRVYILAFEDAFRIIDSRLLRRLWCLGKSSKFLDLDILQGSRVCTTVPCRPP
jgi:hypothetical protein